MSEWISVKERLPALNQVVLVALINWEEPIIACFEEHKLKHANVESFFTWKSPMLWNIEPMLWNIDWKTVTHWMPLPEMPKEDK